MAQVAYPFNAGAGANVTEDQWWRMGQIWAPDGVLSTAGGGAAGELLVFGDGSGFHPNVSAGEAWVKGVYFLNDATLTLPDLATADATNPRIDVVAVRIDWVANTGSIFVVTGTPGVTPAVPSLAGTPGNVFDMMLALVSVAAGATSISSGNVRDARVFTDLAQRIPVGAMMDWPTATAPTGWLLCGGQAVDRVKYRTLFVLLSTTYGIGDNVTTFNLPDLRGRVGVGLDNMGGTGAASRVPSASGVGNSFAGGTETHTMTAGELVSHVHTGGSLVATGAGASNGHVHNVNPSATATDTESAIHHHTVDPPSTNTGNESVVHHHAVDPPSTNTGTESAVHHHAGAAQTALATSNANDTHSHTGGTLAGTTAGGSAHHHTTDFTVGQPAALSGGPFTVAVSTTGNTSDESAHTHTVGSLSGSTAAGTNVHSHTLDVPTADTGDESATHAHAVDISVFDSGNESTTHAHAVDIAAFSSADESATHTHTVDIAAFDSADQSANHTHNTTISGNTGGTGSTTAFSVMQPFLVVGKIIKF